MIAVFERLSEPMKCSVKIAYSALWSNVVVVDNDNSRSGSSDKTTSYGQISTRDFKHATAENTTHVKGMPTNERYMSAV